MKNVAMLICAAFLISLFAGVASADTYTIKTDSGTVSGVFVSNENLNRIFTTTFKNIPGNATDLQFSVYMKNQSCNFEIGNTTDFKTIAGTSYTVRRDDLNATGSWITVTVPAEYNFSDDVILRMVGGKNSSFSLQTDVTSDVATKKINYYYDGTTWVNETTSWSYFSRCQYTLNDPVPAGVLIGSYYPVTTPSETAFNGGADTPRSFFVHDNAARIRATCTISELLFYLNSIPSSTFTVDFYRKNTSGGYDRIGQTANLAGILTTERNIIPCSIPVQEGDYYGFTYDDAGSMKGTTVSPSTTYYCPSTSVATNGFEWTSQTCVENLIPDLHMYTSGLDAVFIGDSIIAGHPSHDSFIEESTTHTQPTHTISCQYGVLSGSSTQNMGIGGQTTGQIKARLAVDALLTPAPKYVFIEGGVNDVEQGVSNATVLANVEQIIQAVDSAGSIPVLILILPWTNGNTAHSDRVNYLNEQYKTFASTYPNLIVIDARADIGELEDTKWVIKEEYDADGVHFTDAGYDALGQAIYTNMPAPWRVRDFYR